MHKAKPCHLLGKFQTKIFVLLLLSGCGHLEYYFAREDLPRTVEQAVNELKTKWLSEKDLDWILRNPKDNVLARLHRPFGISVRNDWYLWSGNTDLLRSAGTNHPEECTRVIFGKLWESVRENADSILVNKLDCQFLLADSINITYRGFRTLRIGEVLYRIQEQMDEQTQNLTLQLCSENAEPIKLKVIGNPNLECWSRVEFSEDGRDPISLNVLMTWISFRNAFEVRHTPPYIELAFRDTCTWPTQPTQFWPAEN